MEQWQKELEERLASLTEEDAGYRNERDNRARRGLPWTLEEHKDFLRFNERDIQQMIEMGR